MQKPKKPPLSKGGGPPQAVEGFPMIANVSVIENPPVSLAADSPLYTRGPFRCAKTLKSLPYR